ncbi:MAM domain-containing glycosylphosphatidylinositol anchor protein 1-like [Mytilus edulis]|uniref:MAM domain-containing glycosylphosphatidylinositol anchor protein 1-like n=1 Tax=Mytilus edulis TaxID=6550 RepID=UPI0039F11C7A
MMKFCCLIVTIFCAIRVSNCGRLTGNCLTSNGKCARKGVACDDAFGEGWIDKGKCCNDRPCCIYKCPNLCRSANYSCGFETPECVFQFVTPISDYVWSYKTGPTNTGGTGPSGAAEGTHYLYTEANNGEKGDTAILTTDAANLPACPYCLSFKYHMMGPEAGSLEICVGEKGLPYGKKWEYIGGLSLSHDDWQKVTLNIPQYCNPVFTIMSTKNGTIGDVAIDDIILRTGACD